MTFPFHNVIRCKTLGEKGIDMEVQSVRFSHTHTAVCSLAAFGPRRLQAEIITLGKQVAGRCGAAFTTLSASQTQKQMHVSEQSAAFQFEVPAGP